MSDLEHAVTAVSGKVELVLEGEQEGTLGVARALVGRGVKSLFGERFPDAFKPRRKRPGTATASGSGESDTLTSSEYRPILEWFAAGNKVEPGDDLSQAEYARRLGQVKGLRELAVKYLAPRNAEEESVAMELVLEGLHQSSMLSRERTDAAGGIAYKDMLKSMLSGLGED